MLAHVWSQVLHDAGLVAAWLDARDPSALPRWVSAVVLVLAAAVLGRIGGRVLAGIMQLALLAASLLVAWQMIHAPAPARASAPAACVLAGTCAAGDPPPASQQTIAVTQVRDAQPPAALAATAGR